MSPDRDLGRHEEDELELDAYDDEEPRSIFSALWFRALLAVLVLGVLAAVAVPYVLDFSTAPAPKSTVAKAPPPGSLAQATATPATAAPATDAPATAAPAAPAVTPAATAAPVETATPAQPAPPPTPIGGPRPVIAARTADTPRPAPITEAVKPEPRKTVVAGTPGGPWWVQVGAYQDAATARRVATRLKEQGLSVRESTTTVGSSRTAPVASAPAQPAGDMYEVVVAGGSTPELDARLSTKNLSGEATGNSVIVKPSLPLRDAVALSRDLADAGLKVQVRRVATAQPVAAAKPATGATTLYRVRVGGYPDRATAVAAMKELEDKGFRPFIARGE